MTIEKIYDFMKRFLGQKCNEQLTVTALENKFYVSNGISGQMGGEEFVIDENGLISELDLFESCDIILAAEESGIPITTYQISKDEIKRL